MLQPTVYSRRYLKCAMFFTVLGPGMLEAWEGRLTAYGAPAVVLLQLCLVVVFLVKPRRWSLFSLIVSTSLALGLPLLSLPTVWLLQALGSAVLPAGYAFVIPSGLKAADVALVFSLYLVFVGLALVSFIDEFRMPVGSDRHAERESRLMCDNIFRRARFLQLGGRYDDALRLYHYLVSSFPSSDYSEKATRAIRDINDASGRTGS